MAANINPVFALTPKTGYATITAATIDKTGATLTNLKELVSAATNGTKVTQIRFKGQGDCSLSLGLIFVTDTNGANPKLFDEVQISSITSSGSVATNLSIINYADLQLAPGQKILVGASVVGDAINVFASIGDF